MKLLLTTSKPVRNLLFQQKPLNPPLTYVWWRRYTPSMQALPADTKFASSLDAEDPNCLCSRCKKQIGASLPIRMWPEDGAYELRYHPWCLGLDYSEPYQDYELDEVLD